MSFQDRAQPEARGQGDGMPGVRLQAFLSRAGVSSRRACAEIVERGRVSVNGAQVLEKGFRVFAGDEVLLDGKPVCLEEQKRYLLLNKPPGYVSTLSDEKGRPTAASLIAGIYPERLYNAGRLDMWSEGALIFTNDGGFALKLIHPSSGIEKEYIVETAGQCGGDALKAFRRGIWIGGAFFRALRAERLKFSSAKIVLVEGKNREIRRVFAHFGIRIKRLRRVRIGCVSLGNLALGEARDLSIEEIEGLRASCRKR